MFSRDLGAARRARLPGARATRRSRSRGGRPDRLLYPARPPRPARSSPTAVSRCRSRRARVAEVKTMAAALGHALRAAARGAARHDAHGLRRIRPDRQPAHRRRRAQHARRLRSPARDVARQGLVPRRAHPLRAAVAELWKDQTFGVPIAYAPVGFEGLRYGLGAWRNLVSPQGDALRARARAPSASRPGSTSISASTESSWWSRPTSRCSTRWRRSSRWRTPRSPPARPTPAVAATSARRPPGARARAHHRQRGCVAPTPLPPTLTRHFGSSRGCGGGWATAK